MATILEFKIPEKKDQDEIIDTPVVMSSVNDVMLIIHHAIHGSDDSYQPTDRKLAAQLFNFILEGKHTCSHVFVINADVIF